MYTYEVRLNTNFDSYASKYQVIVLFQGKTIGKSFATTKWTARLVAKSMMKKHRRYHARSSPVVSRHDLR